MYYSRCSDWFEIQGSPIPPRTQKPFRLGYTVYDIVEMVLGALEPAIEIRAVLIENTLWGTEVRTIASPFVSAYFVFQTDLNINLMQGDVVLHTQHDVRELLTKDWQHKLQEAAFGMYPGYSLTHRARITKGSTSWRLETGKQRDAHALEVDCATGALLQWYNEGNDPCCRNRQRPLLLFSSAKTNFTLN